MRIPDGEQTEGKHLTELFQGVALLSAMQFPTQQEHRHGCSVEVQLSF